MVWRRTLRVVHMKKAPRAYKNEQRRVLNLVRDRATGSLATRQRGQAPVSHVHDCVGTRLVLDWLDLLFANFSLA